MSPQDILVDFFGRRNFAADIAIILSFLVLYGLLAAVLLGRLLRRYPVEESWPVTLAMTALASLAFGFGGMLSSAIQSDERAKLQLFSRVQQSSGFRPLSLKGVNA